MKMSFSLQLRRPIEAFITNRYWLMFLVIASILAYCAGLPLLPQNVSLLLSALVVGLAFLFILIKHPTLGLFAIIATLLISINGPSGVNATMGMVALCCGLWLLKAVLQKQHIQPVKSRSTRPLLIFVLYSMVPFALGQIQWYRFGQQAPLGAQLGGITVFVLSAGAFLLMTNLIKRIDDLEWLVWLFLILAAVNVAGWLLPVLSPLTTILFRESTGSQFWLWGTVLSFSQAVINKDLKIRWRVLLFTLVIAMMYVAYFINFDWKSGWIPSVVSVMAVMALRYWSIVRWLLPLGIIPIVQSVQELISTDQYSWGTRVDAWILVGEIAQVNPLFGLGFANYRWYTLLFPIRGYSVYYFSHSQYVDLVAQIGIIGLLLFLYFFFVVWCIGWDLMNRVPDGFPRAYVIGALGGLIGMLVAGALGDWILGFFYNVGMTGFRHSVLGWMFLGGLIALGNLSKISDLTGIEVNSQ